MLTQYSIPFHWSLLPFRLLRSFKWILLSSFAFMISCGRNKLPDPTAAGLDAVERMVELARSARPQGEVVLILLNDKNSPEIYFEEWARQFAKSWDVKNAPLVEYRIAREEHGDSVDPRLLAKPMDAIPMKEYKALQEAHPTARLFISFCGLPPKMPSDPGIAKWIAYCPNGVQNTQGLAHSPAWIAVIQPRTSAPPQGSNHFDTFYSLDTPTTLSVTEVSP